MEPSGAGPFVAFIHLKLVMDIQVSVIVPTHNRKNLLLRLLDSLLQQSLPAEAYEIIVVCNRVTDGSDEAVANLCRRHPCLRVLDQAQGGPAAARNAGAKVANGRYLAFTDDDCVVSRGWLNELVETLNRFVAVGVEGRTVTIPSLCTPLTHQMESNGTVFVAPTCNVAYRRDAFEEIGGFEERFPFAHNEDADLAWRIEALGQICYAPEALVIHPPRPESFKNMVLWVRYFESEFLLFARNPVAYRKHRSRSPWVTIYWKIFVDSNFQRGKAAIKDTLFRGRPDYSLLQLALILARSCFLIGLFPRFFHASHASRPSAASYSRA